LPLTYPAVGGRAARRFMRAAKVFGVAKNAVRPWGNLAAGTKRGRHDLAQPGCLASAFSEYLTWIKAKIASSPI